MISWYTCKNAECNYSVEVEKEYGKEWKATIKCSKCGERMSKDYGKNFKDTTVIIPEHMRHDSNQMDFNRMDRSHRKYY